MVETVAPDTPHINEDPVPASEESASCPFEGPEKLLEIWFSAAPDNDVQNSDGTRTGLRTVDRAVWEDMLDIVKCKVLSVVIGREMDAYLLSESSFFVFPHKLILKTCGTTLNLLGLPRILAIARTHCGYENVWRCFYSRKSFMFPERQVGPHREWRNEVEYLDALFDNGAAYTVGKVNGDHWLLYMTSPSEPEGINESDDDEASPAPNMTATVASIASSDTLPQAFVGQDCTLEILMTKLAAGGRRPFLFLEEDLAAHSSDLAAVRDANGSDAVSKAKGALVSRQLGIDSIFPKACTRLDSYAFEPCGYSANALVDSGADSGEDEGYYTIHVTPEEGWSYASFESNVPIHLARPHHDIEVVGQPDDVVLAKRKKDRMPDLETVIQRVVNIFQPGHISLTLFISSSEPGSPQATSIPLTIGDTHQTHCHCHHTGDGPTDVEIAQRAFRQALLPRGYRRTDKINYEFGDYDLAFATFQKR